MFAHTVNITCLACFNSYVLQFVPDYYFASLAAEHLIYYFIRMLPAHQLTVIATN